MPKIVIETPEIYEAITRPAVTDIVRNFVAFTGLPSETDIQYRGDSLSIPQKGSTTDIDFKHHRESFAKLPHSERIWITVEERYPDENAATTAVLRPEQLTYFTDTDLDVYMKPVYQRCEIRITINCRTRDRAGVVRWRNEIMRNIARGQQTQLHELTYHYPIPQEFIVILDKIHELRENNHGLSETLGDYIKRCMDKRFTTIANRKGDNPTMVIRETQLGVQGWFDFPYATPNPDKDSAGGSWTVSFDYVTSMDVPTESVMQYPILVHNQLMPKKFRSEEHPYDWRDRYYQAGLSKDVFNHLIDPIFLVRGGFHGLSIPHFDDWLPNYEPPLTVCIFRACLAVNPTDLRDILDLQDVGGYQIEQDAIDYLLDNPSGMLTPGQSAFRLTLYQKYKPIENTILTVTSDLKVRATEDLSMTVMKHLLLSLDQDVAGIQGSAKALLIKHGSFCRKYFLALAPDIEQAGYLPPLRNDGSLNPVLYEKAVKYITLMRPGAPDYGRSSLNAVGQFIIQAERRTEDAATSG